MRDYDALASCHYRAARPATCVRVLVARASEACSSEPPIGVLVVSRPAINAPWRPLAWPELFATAAARGDHRRRSLARANQLVRVISRVIVALPWRGQGVATALVRSYLARPCTPCTEALAAMGEFSSFFAAAGMRRVEYPPARRVQVLLEQLAHLDIPPWRLADASSLLTDLPRHHQSTLARALRTFADAHRDTRRHADALLNELIELAARRINAPPVAFVAESHRRPRLRTLSSRHRSSRRPVQLFAGHD